MDRLEAGRQYSFEETFSVRGAADLARQRYETEVGISGRLLAMRDLGGVCFGDLRDMTGAVQLVAENGATPDFEAYAGRLVVGDWIGVSGTTGVAGRKDSPSVFVRDWVRLAQNQEGLPDRRNGLGTEMRARLRWVDLATNQSSMDRFVARSQIVSLMRRGLEERGFIEVETPILQTIHGGANARPFSTYHNALGMEMSLRIAPELHLKRLIIGGMKRIYEIGKSFRNEGIDQTHNPEFTTMEAYAAGWDADDQMRLTEQIIQEIAINLYGTDQISYQGEEVDLSTPWQRVTMDELVSGAVGSSVNIDTKRGTLRDLCVNYGIEFAEDDPSGVLLAALYEKLAEDSLRGPVFVTDYPVDISPLARSHRSRPGYTERFEGIVAGRELCNGYTELNDPRVQFERLRDQEAQRGRGDPEAMRMDHDYIRAMRFGLPPTGGLGIGIDRLAMLLTDTESIRDVILFPAMKPDGYKAPY